jgi:Ca2+-dependent lipid-binding protein
MVSLTADSLCMQIRLFISARNLKNLDVFSKSDPKCAVYELVNKDWKLVGKTETINNNLNPDFATSIQLGYYFEKLQKLKFVMMDSDEHTDDDLIGEFETTVAAIMERSTKPLDGQLKFKNHEKGRGTIVIRSEAVAESNT